MKNNEQHRREEKNNRKRRGEEKAGKKRSVEKKNKQTGIRKQHLVRICISSVGISPEHAHSLCCVVFSNPRGSKEYWMKSSDNNENHVLFGLSSSLLPPMHHCPARPTVLVPHFLPYAPLFHHARPPRWPLTSRVLSLTWRTPCSAASSCSVLSISGGSTRSASHALTASWFYDTAAFFVLPRLLRRSSCSRQQKEGTFSRPAGVHPPPPPPPPPRAQQRQPQQQQRPGRLAREGVAVQRVHQEKRTQDQVRHQRGG